MRGALRLFARWLARSAPRRATRAQGALPDAVREARTILVVALAETGDMVLLSVFLGGLRRLAPSARVTLVCLPGVRSLFECCSDIDEVITYDAVVPRLTRPFVLPWRARTFAHRELLNRFDVAIVPRWDTDHHLAAAVSLFSGAPRRVWYSEFSTERKAILNAGFDMLFTDVLTSAGVAHEVERHLGMLHALGAADPARELRLALSDDDRRRARAALSSIGAAGPVVALGIGAAHPKRRWPLTRFAEIGRRLQREHGAHVVVVGGPDDAGAQAELLHMLGPAATGVAGLLTLRESAAVLERCQLFIGNDSAPLHLAAAAGVPCVEISCHPADGDPLHHNAPERFGPFGVRAIVARPTAAVPPCTSSCAAPAPHCILGVEEEAVWNAAECLLRGLALAEPSPR